jgi:amidase
MKRLNKENFVFTMSKEHSPSLYITSGETVVYETQDCYCGRIKAQEDAQATGLGNPATGPLYIEGAETGDILKVEILDIKVADQGIMRLRPGIGTYGDYLKEATVKVIPIKENLAIFNDKLQIPVRPMIGVIGVAPEGGAIETIVPDVHGGNLDCKRIVKGATVYLPVFAKGGLLAVGDLHALMADGETAICGLEVQGEVTVRVNVIKNKNLPLPMVVEGNHIMTLSSMKTLDEASKQASINMHKFLTQELKMDTHEAAMLLSLCGDLRVCQIVDPLITARMELPLEVLKKYEYKMI